MVARAVHKISERRNKTMVKLNCAAIPAALLESELFGHETGAFTGAVNQKMEKFEIANNSTIFLDEFGEIPVELELKLLMVLQEGDFGAANILNIKPTTLEARMKKLQISKRRDY